MNKHPLHLSGVLCLICAQLSIAIGYLLPRMKSPICCQSSRQPPPAPAPPTQTYSGLDRSRLFPQDVLIIPEIFSACSGTGVWEERGCGCAPQGTLPGPVPTGLHPQHAPPPRPGVPNSAARFQKRGKSSLRPVALVCTRLGIPGLGEIKGARRENFGEEGASLGIEFPGRGERASLRTLPWEFAEPLLKKTVNPFLLGQIGRLLPSRVFFLLYYRN